MLNPPHVAVLPGDPLAAVGADQAMAYIGPGVGLGVIILVAALVLGGLLLLMGLVWYPLKRLRKPGAEDTASTRRTDERE